MELPSEALIVFNKILENSKTRAKSELIQKMIQWKVEHTFRVVEIGKRILDQEKVKRWDEERAISALLLHDVGRFEQALLRSYSDKTTGVSHAVLGAMLLEESNYGDREIIDAVRDHSLPEYIGDNVYTKLVKDADQLTIIGEEYQLENVPEQEVPSDEVKRVIELGVRLDTSITEGRIDMLLAYWNWKRFLYWDASKEIFQKLGYNQLLYKKLEALDRNRVTIDWLENKTSLLAATV